MSDVSIENSLRKIEQTLKEIKELLVKINNKH